MITRSRKKLKVESLSVGDTFVVPVSEFNRVKNITGIIRSVQNKATGGITISTRHGSPEGIFYSNQDSMFDNGDLYSQMRPKASQSNL